MSCRCGLDGKSRPEAARPPLLPPGCDGQGASLDQRAMKTTSCRTFLVEGIKYNSTLLRIDPESGLHGWGEATN